MKGTQICQNLIKIFFNAFIDPMFECVSENVLETWQKNNHTFKKTEYTMKLEVNKYRVISYRDFFMDD